MQVSDEIIKVLDYLGQKIGMTIDWSSNNVLPYAEEICGKYVNYDVATSIVYMILITIVFAVSLVLAVIGTKRKWSNDVLGFTHLITFILGGLFVVIISHCTLEIIKCRTIPEMVIYEKISELLSK